MSSKHSGHTRLLRQDKLSSASGGGGLRRSVECEAEGATACMRLTRVLVQTPFLTGGLWQFSTFAVLIKLLTDQIVCVWVSVSYSNFFMERTSDLKALCLVRKPLEWDNGNPLDWFL